MQLRETAAVIAAIFALLLLYADRQQADAQTTCRDLAAVHGRAGP